MGGGVYLAGGGAGGDVAKTGGLGGGAGGPFLRANVGGGGGGGGTSATPGPALGLTAGAALESGGPGFLLPWSLGGLCPERCWVILITTLGFPAEVRAVGHPCLLLAGAAPRPAGQALGDLGRVPGSLGCRNLYLGAWTPVWALCLSPGGGAPGPSRPRRSLGTAFLTLFLPRVQMSLPRR